MKWLLAILVLTVAGCSAESDIATYVDITTEGDVTTNSIGMKFKLIPVGTFMMGSEEGLDREQPVHQVTLTQPFLLGVYEVTQKQYERVMGSNPSKFKGFDNPVDQVSWENAVEFCRRLSELPAEKAAGNVFRLPTEAEWEYACRAGTTTMYSFGDDESQLSDYAWCKINSGSQKHPVGQTHPVGQKQANAWGLYDMQGNVSELCSDCFFPYPSGSMVDPTGPQLGVNMNRVSRGGYWFSSAESCRSSRRSAFDPSASGSGYGFRVACVQSGQSSE